jgi:hypothetical protein
MTTLLDSATVKVDGTDLAATGVQVLWEGSLFDAIDDVFDTISYSGSNESDVTSGYAQPKTWTVRCRVTGTDLDDAWAKIHALRRRTKPGRKVQLTRYMPGGEDGSLTALLAYARRLGDTIAWNERNDQQAVVGTDFTVLGFWYPGSATNIASAAGTQSIGGDLPTYRMTFTLAAGAARTVANATNGHSFTFSTTVPTGGVLIDVEARTATAITGGADLSAYLSWTKLFPMRLDPGSNVLTVSAVSASIDYKPAYL